MKLTTNFYLQEFVSKAFYDFYGEKCIRYLDPKLPIMAQGFRDRLGVPIIINNWVSGGPFNYRGYRDDSFYYEEINSGLYELKRKGLGSQHRFGRAIDFHTNSITPDEIREDIKKNFDVYKKMGITTIEENVNWVHVDMRWTNKDDLFLVYP